MTITMGPLVLMVLDAYGRRFQDEELAAVMTEKRIAELLEQRDGARRPLTLRKAV